MGFLTVDTYRQYIKEGPLTNPNEGSYDEEIILTTTDQVTPQVKALGLSLNCKAADLHIFVDGVDITKNVVWGELSARAFEDFLRKRI